jgi:rhamnulose-1-phosphate aldolase/alcohol dehydrogenase
MELPTFRHTRQRERYRMSTLSRLHSLWNNVEAGKKDPLGQLVYRSNLLGSDQTITNTGGGNTSAKSIEKDPLTGKEVEVLWVKGSGGDLRTSTKENFSSLYQEKLLALQQVYSAAPGRGPKSPVEDAMVGMYNHCTFNLNPRASSIDTPLHSFIPKKHVDHMHPNAAIAVAASKNGERLTKEIFGNEVVWTPWQRPGFDLGLQLQDLCRAHPEARGAMLGKHGLIDWADDGKECYELTLRLIDKAAGFIASKEKGMATFGGTKYAPLDEERRRSTLVHILPWLRGQISQKKRMIGTVHANSRLLEFVNSYDAPRLAGLGTSCPDHFLRTKIKPLYVAWDPHADSLDTLKAELAEGMAKYREDYAAYYDRCKHRDSPAMRDANPTVVLIPGLGMICWGKDKSESRVTAEFYDCAVDVMRGSEAIDEYTSLPQQEAFDIEYWLLEEAKLKRMPPEKELARRVAVVIGAGSGIGREVAHRLVREGEHVAAVDLVAEGARATAEEITGRFGPGIGVAGTGISSCGPAIGLPADITRRESIRAMLDEVILAYGGFDDVIVTAGVFVPPDKSGRVTDDQWAKTYSINVMGSYQVADEVAQVLRQQSLPANLVLTTSVNAVVSKKGSMAYDTSKAAANHLLRELAVELAPLVRVNAVAPATVIAGSSMFPRDRVVASLTKYQIAFDEKDSDEVLIGKLSRFYADRTLTKQPILPADLAEAVFLLVSPRLAKTTGQIISVDGGLHEAFLR